MKKIFVLCAFISLKMIVFAQTKYFDFESTQVDFKIDHSILNDTEFVSMVNLLKATPNLNNFDRENESTLTFSYQVFDQTKLNDVQKDIQNLISANQVFVEFADLRNVPLVFIPNTFSQSRFFISNH
jgi:hypothetical protein